MQKMILSIFLVFLLFGITLNAPILMADDDSWKSDNIELWQYDAGVYGCFGCDGGICADPPEARITKVEETEERYCNGNFEVISDDDLDTTEDNLDTTEDNLDTTEDNLDTTDEDEDDDKDSTDEDDSDDDKRERVRIKIERDRERVRMREEIKIEFVADDGSIVKIERKVEVENGKVKVKIKRKVTYLNGTVIETTIIIERDENTFKKKIKIEGVDGLEVETELEINDEFEGNETDLVVVMSNGRRALIKIMPDAASEIALERLRALNFTKIELKEIRHKNVPRVVYNIETNKEGRFFGIFKLKLKIEGRVDSETGEFIGISKPWWAFFVVGEETDETGEEPPENETETNTTG